MSNESQKSSLDENLINNSYESDINVSTRQSVNDNNYEEEIEYEETPVGEVEVGNLSDWFMNNHRNIPSISNVRAEIKHVDPRKNLIMTAPDKKNKERYVWVFRDANKLPVLDLPPYNMRVFHSNTFEIDHFFNDEIKLITYNMKNKLLVFPAIIIDNTPVPYTYVNVLNEDTIAQIPNIDQNLIKENVEKDVDFDYVMTKYKHIRRKKGKVSTNMDVIKELDYRKGKVHDIRHLLTIDFALVDIANQR